MDQRIWGSAPNISLAQLGPRRLAGLLGWVLHPLRPPLGRVGHRGIGGNGGRRGEVDREGPSGIGGSGQAQLAFPLPTQAKEAFWAFGSSPLSSRAPSGHVGPRTMGGGRRREAYREGPSRVTGSEGNVPSISSAHLGPVSLLGSWTWSSTLQGLRHSWSPPAALSLSPTPQPPQGLFQPCES